MFYIIFFLTAVTIPHYSFRKHPHDCVLSNTAENLSEYFPCSNVFTEHL